MISFAKQSGNWVQLYDERNCLTWRLEGKLVGYTSETVSIEKDNGSVWIYDSRGTLQCMR